MLTYDKSEAVEKKDTTTKKDVLSPIDVSLSSLEDVTSTINDIFEDLYEKVAPVLSPDTPEKSWGEVGPEEDSKSPLQDRIDNVSHTLRDIARKASSFNRRISL